MNKKNIIFNMTLEQYNKRYKNRRCHLLKFTKNEVNEFSKKNNVEYKFFLESRKWALIGDTYYEIPKPIRFTWFRNLNACVQASICLLGAAVVATAITLPIVLQTQSKEEIAIIDSSLSEYMKITKTETNAKGDAVIYIEPLKKGDIPGETVIKKGEHELINDTDYKFELKSENEATLTVFKETMDKYPGKIVIKLNEFKGEVTSDEWDAAIKQILSSNLNRNLSANLHMSLDGKNYYDASFLLNKTEEKYSVKSNSAYVKKESETYYEYVADEWEEKEDQKFYFDSLSPVTDVLKKLIGQKDAGFTFKDGQYVSKSSESVKLIIKFASHTNISYYYLDEGEAKFEYKFSGYNTTTISDFPPFEKPEIAEAIPEYFAYTDKGDGTISIKYNSASNADLPSNLTIASKYSINGKNKTVIEIENDGFREKSALNTVTIGKKVTKLGSYCFYGCDNLSTISFEKDSNLKEIMDYAFSNGGLTSFKVPSKFETFGANPFAYCNNFGSFSIEEGNERFITDNNGKMLLSKNGELISYPSAIGSIDLSGFNNITILSNGCFNWCSITSIVFPSNLTKIGASCFTGCKINTAITIPSTVTYIGGDAFTGNGGSFVTSSIPSIAFEDTQNWYENAETPTTKEVDVTNPTNNVNILTSLFSSASSVGIRKVTSNN